MAARPRGLLVMLLAGALVAPPAVVAGAEPSVETLLAVWSTGNHQRTEYRAPEATVGASFYTSDEETLSVYAWNGTTTVDAVFKSGSGHAIELGRTYTSVPYVSFRSPASPGASCEGASVTIWELAADPDWTVTRLAMDMFCPAAGVLTTIRINSSRPYAWLSDTAITFPALYPGETADASYTLTAQGTTSVTISALGLQYGEPAITVASETCSGVTLAPGDTCTATLRFAPTSPGWTQASLRVETDLQPAVLSRFTWAEAQNPFTVAPSTLALGSVPATATTDPGTLTVGFTGPGTGSVAGLTFAGPDATRFAVASDGCAGVTLADGQTCTIGVVATPLAIGAIAGALQVDLGANGGTREVALTAAGTDPVSITPSVTLPAIRPGEATTAVITVSSLAAVTLPVSSVELPGNTNEAFAITANGCAGGVPAAGSCAIEVTFSPPSWMSPDLQAQQSVQVLVSGPGLVGTRTSQVLGSIAYPSLGATWTAKSSLGNRWNFGNALARTVSGTTPSLVQVTSSDRVGSRAVTDSGAKMPVYLNRSTNGGASWASSVRVNSSTQHGIWPVVAASGSFVAVAWASAGKVVRFSNTAPRALYVRINSRSGTGTWRPVQRLSSLSGRIDHPAIAMSGALVVVGYTNSVTGTVKLAISRDRGTTWRTVALGTTSLKASWGRTGLVSVAASGSTIVVSWVASLYGSTKLRLSTDSGRSWSGSKTFVGGQDRAALAIAGNRVGIGWLGEGWSVQVRTAGTWGPVRPIPIPYGRDNSGTLMTYVIYGPSIALYGTTGVAATISGQYSWCGDCDDGRGSDLLWSESSTNGATWAATERIATPDYTYSYRDDPSIVWASPTLRTVLVNAWGYASKTTLITGTTAGLAPAMAPAMTPDPARLEPGSGATPLPAAFAGPWGAAGPER